ncbi:uncharacterized protein LOC142239981 [Haematobia irritans]|uniref:uncharacterized protein LOC142239981 n=1 Tax=Haematobia irritans TaxID=7368 RepID=UPI003F503353
MCAFVIKIQGAKRQFDLVVHDVACNISDPDWVKIFTCTLNKLATSRYSFGFCYELSRSLDTNAEAWIRMYYNIARSKRIVKLIDLRMRICDAFNTIQRIPMVQNVLIELRRSSNLPIECPLKKNYLYNVSNMMITDAIIPMYAGNFEFNITLDYYETRKKLGGSCKIRGSIEPKRKRAGAPSGLSHPKNKMMTKLQMFLQSHTRTKFKMGAFIYGEMYKF